MDKEEIVAENIFRELSKDTPDPFAIPPMLTDESLNKDYLRDIIDSWNTDMVDKYHNAVLRVEKFYGFLAECEEEDERLGL